jgi:hypothetical protein
VGAIREIVGERLADVSIATHALALFDIEQKYGDVVSLADATAYLSSRNENRRSA